jgi:mRNA interferase MazF
MASVGELWLVDFGERYPGESASRRPALVVGPTGIFGSSFPYLFVVPLTTSLRGLDLHVEVEPSTDNGLDSTSAVQCELLRSVSRRRLVHRIGVVDSKAMFAVDRILRTLLGH